MKYLYKSTSIKAIKTAFYIVLFGLLILGQMSCTSETKSKLETGENALYLCKFVTPDGVTTNTNVFQRDSMYRPSDTLINSKYGTWIVMRKR